LQVKPPPGFPSSTKAEIFAILHTVRHCAPGCHLTVFTDSQAAIDAIKKCTNLVSERNLLKLSCHGMLSVIHEITSMQLIKLDLVKVKGHSGISMNELADSLAKDARALPASHHDPLLQVNDDYLLDLCHMETLLHQDSIPIEIYPSKLLKSVPYAQWSTATNATLAKHNPGIPTANWDLTLRLINIGCGKIDHLDSSHTNETAFRLRLLTGRLQTNARIHGFGTLPDAKCPRCPCPSETRDHFLACPANVALLPCIVARTRELLVSRMSSARHWSPLTSIRNAPAGLLKALMLTRPNCLSSPTAKGIITSQLVNRVSRKLKAKLPLQTRRLAAMYAADCLLTAVYETAWKHRWHGRQRAAAGMFMITAKAELRRAAIYWLSLACWVYVVVSLAINIPVHWHAKIVLSSFAIGVVGDNLILALFLVRLRVFYRGNSFVFWGLTVLGVIASIVVQPANYISIAANVRVLNYELEYFTDDSRIEAIGKNLGLSKQGFLYEIMMNHDGLRFLVIIGLNITLTAFNLHASFYGYNYITYCSWYLIILVQAIEIRTFLIASYEAPRELLNRSRQTFTPTEVRSNPNQFGSRQYGSQPYSGGSGTKHSQFEPEVEQQRRDVRYF
ncbi:hypothetical protein HK105_207929, partial [Polyrhizophydium stewartii]